ncbi:hypothetical protein HTY52_12970 [Cupriavidus taiwanensis]|uniref:ribosome modulation factor n=1 Tax=Cupriavidus taiwanensis TaxID=164546 RepID=UPI0015733651|nr:Rmf/CrpP family protein [Cupriavidus taiwanensis]NSX14988.1 hypothetical protein [Cupriavidus taiwanensis]
MEQIRTREAIRAEGAHAARQGTAMSACPYAEGTDAREEWENGYCQACARAVVANSAAIRVAA